MYNNGIVILINFDFATLSPISLICELGLILDQCLMGRSEDAPQAAPLGVVPFDLVAGCKLALEVLRLILWHLV